MSTKQKLDELRREIDKVDSRLLMNLKDRQLLIEQIAKVKRELQLDAHQPQRFGQLLGRLKQEASDVGLDPQLIENVWSAIHDSSLEFQQTANQE